MADDSLNLDEDLKELGKNNNNDNNFGDILNQVSFPPDNSMDGNNDKGPNSLLDSQHDVNKAIIYQNSTEKITTSKKEFDPKLILVELEESNADQEKHLEGIKMEVGTIQQKNCCGLCGEFSCVLI